MANASRQRDDVLRYNIADAGRIASNFADGYDVVEILGSAGLPQVRVTFTSAEVGNDNFRDAGTMMNQDGSFAVRVQAEDTAGALTGGVDRFDDEGISFVSDGSFTFDVRDLVSGAERGNFFDIVRLGTLGADTYLENVGGKSVYINAGQGDDFIRTTLANDFLVGGAGNDELRGLGGNDSYIGGAGNDTILDTGNNGNDTVIFNVTTDGADLVNLGGGFDRVNVTATGATQVRLTFTSSEVGNGNVNDSGTMANQDGGLGIRLQAEDGSDGLTGALSRFDDEGVLFVGLPGVLFDVRDLPTGTQRGDGFQVVSIGTRNVDVIDFTGIGRTYYVNAGAGNDRITGGTVADFLVGGVGNDTINGITGNDTFIGGMGNDTFVFTDDLSDDRIIDFASGTDKLDLRAFDIGFGDITQRLNGTERVLDVDVNGDSAADFTITLVNGAMAAQTDFLF